MRAPMKATVLLVVMVLASFTVVSAQYYEPAVFINLDEVVGLDAELNIPDEGPVDLTFPIRFINVDANRTAISNGYKFYATGCTFGAVTGAWNANYPWDWPMAIALGIFPPYFDQGLFLNEFEDGVGFAGLTGASGSGLPADFNGIAYNLSVAGVDGEPNDVLTLDSSWWAPANYWLWSGVAENVYWGGPYDLIIAGGPPPPPYTTCWPQPTILKELENDKILNVAIHNEVIEDVVFSSILVQGKIPPYTAGAPYVDGDSIVTDCFIMRFLGSSGFRPIPPEGVQDQYTVEYDKVGGEHVVLTGDYVLSVYNGDVTLDGLVDINDVEFMAGFLWKNGPACEINEFMDIDANGRVDIRDLSKLIEIVGI